MHPSSSSPRRLRTVLTLTAAAALTVACGGGRTVVETGSGDYEVNLQPSFFTTATTTAYDGTSDDLLTAGLGRAGLASK